MIDFTNKTYAEILAAQLARVPGTVDKREGSVIQTALGPESWYLEGFYLDLDRIQKNAYAKTAGGESLDLICAERGIVRKAATRAVKSGEFNVSVPVGARFSSMGVGEYLVYKAMEATGGENGAYTYNLECETPGQVGNSYTGQLMAISYVNGLTGAVLSTLTMAGTEEETDDSLRARFLATFDVPAFGGNISAYRNLILSIDGVGAVQVYPAWQGGGTVLCSILDGNYLPAGSGLIKLVQDIICPPESGEELPSPNGYGQAPIGAAVTITTAAELTVNVSCTIQFSATVQNGEEIYRNEIETKIADYIRTVNRAWGDPLKTQKVAYVVAMYLSRLSAAILTVPQVVNVTGVMVNGSREDLICTETAELQQLLALGTVIINGS